MNQTINTLVTHRTTRQFDGDFQLPKDQLDLILQAARQAPSTMNGQNYSIIVVDDPAQKEQVANLMPGNDGHVKACACFLLFVADLHRAEVACALRGKEIDVTGKVEALVVAATDTAWAMAQAVTAVEGLGLGSVVVGSVRPVSRQLIALFDLPPYTIPFCGLSIGKPLGQTAVKPRLPQEAVVFYGRYDDSQMAKAMAAYDQTMVAFGEARETKEWTEKIADYFGGGLTANLNDILQSQKWMD